MTTTTERPIDTAREIWATLDERTKGWLREVFQKHMRPDKRTINNEEKNHNHHGE